MTFTSILAIYLLFWVISAFLVLPFGIRSMEEMGQEKIPGQQDGVPGNFNPTKVLMRTTILSAILFGLFYLNYINGWIDRDSFNFVFDPPVDLQQED